MTNTNPQNDPLASESFYALPGRDGVYRESGNDGQTKYLEKVRDDAINFRLSIPASETRREVEVTLRGDSGAQPGGVIAEAKQEEPMDRGTNENVDLTSQEHIVRTDPTNLEDIPLPAPEPAPVEWVQHEPEIVMAPQAEIVADVLPEASEPMSEVVEGVETVTGPSDDIESLRPLDMPEESVAADNEEAGEVPTAEEVEQEPVVETPAIEVPETPAAPPEPTRWQRFRNRMLNAFGGTGERRRENEEFVARLEREAQEAGQKIAHGATVTKAWWMRNVSPKWNRVKTWIATHVPRFWARHGAPRVNAAVEWWNTETPRSWNTKSISARLQEAGDELTYGAVRPESPDDHHRLSNENRDRLLARIPAEEQDVYEAAVPALEMFHNLITSSQHLAAARDALCNTRDAGRLMELAQMYDDTMVDSLRFTRQAEAVLRAMRGGTDASLKDIRINVLEPRLRYIRDLMSEFSGYSYKNMARYCGLKFTTTARLANAKNAYNEAKRVLALCV